MVGPPLRARFNGLSESREFAYLHDRRHQNPGLPKGEPNPGFRGLEVPGWDNQDFARPSMLTAKSNGKTPNVPKVGWVVGGSNKAVWPGKKNLGQKTLEGSYWYPYLHSHQSLTHYSL